MLSLHNLKVEVRFIVWPVSLMVDLMENNQGLMEEVYPSRQPLFFVVVLIFQNEGLDYWMKCQDPVRS